MSDKFQVLVRDVMAKPIAIAKSAFVSEALEKMLNEGVDPLIVTNNGTVIGTTSRAAIAETLGSRKTQAMKATSIHVANTVEENFTSAYPDQNIDILVPLLQHYKLIVDISRGKPSTINKVLPIPRILLKPSKPGMRASIASEVN